MLLHLEGWDQYTTNSLPMTFNPASGSVNPGGGRFGGNAFSPTGPNRRPINPVGGLIVGFAVINPTGIILNIENAAAMPQISLVFDSTNNRIVVKGSDGTILVSTANGVVNPGLWIYIEMKIAGWGNNQLVTLQCLGVQTSNSGTTGSAPPVSYSWQSGAGAVDDNYWFDTSGNNCNNFAGERTVTLQNVVNNGRINSWSPTNQTQGGNYTCVDDTAPDGDATYVSSNVSGEIETYKVAAPSPQATEVDAVYVVAAVRRDNIGQVQVKVGVGNGTAESFGPSVTPPSSYIYTGTPFSFNPLTNRPWTGSDLDNLQVAVEIT